MNPNDALKNAQDLTNRILKDLSTKVNLPELQVNLPEMNLPFDAQNMNIPQMDWDLPGPVPGGQSGTPPSYPGTIERGSAGKRAFRLYVPTTVHPSLPAPLVVALHGCNQTPEQFAVDTELNHHAEERGFLVLYPEQAQQANGGRCWNWFHPKHQQRGAGEPAAIAEMVRQVQARRRVDPARVFALGISAGGAMAVVLGVTYPDLFRALALSAGLPYMQGVPMHEVLNLSARRVPDPRRQGERAFQAMGTHARPLPLIAFHGRDDQRVPLAHADALMAQWGHTNTLAAGASGRPITEVTKQGRVPGGHAFEHTVYLGAGFVMERYVVDGMGHAYAGAPADALQHGGSPFTDSRGPKATERSLDFFGLPVRSAVALGAGT